MKNPTSKIKRFFQPHKFVAALQRSNEPCKLIRGYIGEPEYKNHVRVYLDVELRRWVEVPQKDILYLDDARERYGDASSISLWVREKSAVRHFGHWFANEDPTTMATGEEGGGDPTTMATGEESTGPFNPLDEVVNPLGNF
jgi:hypothetical protein